MPQTSDPDAPIVLHAIGHVASTLRDTATAPRQPDEGAPPACLVFRPAVRDALRGIRVGDALVVITWLHRARRDLLRVHPRDDVARPPLGVFATRSADRPNPIGLHRVEVLAVDGLRVRVRALEAIDGTPVLDVKPLLASAVGAR